MACDLTPLVPLKNMQKEYGSRKGKVDELLSQQKSIKLPLMSYKPLSKPDENEVDELSVSVKNLKLDRTSVEEQYLTSKKTIKKFVGEIDQYKKYVDEAEREYLKKTAERKGFMKSSKYFGQVIKIYLKTLNLLIAIEKQMDDNIFVASVKLAGKNTSPTDNVMHLIVNRRTRSVIDFEFPLRKEEELETLKQELMHNKNFLSNKCKLLLKRFKDMNEP